MHGSIEKAPGTINLPVWFWVVGGIALVWNLVGLAAFVSQVTIDASSLPAAERAIYESTPLWATIAFFVAVACGVLGCIALLMRRAIALPVLVASFAGIVVQMTHSLLMTEALAVYGPSALVVPTLTLTIAAALIGLSRYAITREWLSRPVGG